MAKFNPPQEFDFVPEHWREWSARWERYYSISKLKDEDEVLQVDSFLYCMGSHSESILQGLNLTDEDRKKFKEVKSAFDKYFSPRKYVIFERARFFKREQMPGESVEQFVRALNEIADKCEFGERRSEQMRDKIVVGVRDSEVAKEMQKMDVDKLTEETAIAMARQAEQVEKNFKELHASSSSSSTVAGQGDGRAVDAVKQRKNISQLKPTAQAQSSSKSP